MEKNRKERKFHVKVELVCLAWLAVWMDTGVVDAKISCIFPTTEDDCRRVRTVTWAFIRMCSSYLARTFNTVLT